MAITFPNSPSSGDTHTTSNGLQYTYDGEKWTTIGTNSAGTWTRTGTTVSLTTAGDDLNVDSGTLFVDASTDRVGVGTASPSSPLHVKDGTNYNFTVAGGNSSTGMQIGNYDATDGYNPLTFRGSQYLFVSTAGAERMRIDSSGRLLVGESSAVLASDNALLQMGAAAGANMVLYRDASTVAADDSIGLIRFYSNAGSSKQEHARITAIAGAASGANDKPGALLFYTTADGASSPSERLRIDSSGRLGLGTSSPSEKLTVAGDGSFSGGIRSTGNNSGSWSSGSGLEILNAGINAYNRTTSAYIAASINTLNWTLNSDGNATFAGGVVTINNDLLSHGTGNKSITLRRDTGKVAVSTDNASGSVFEGQLNQSTTSFINSDGSSEFSGIVTGSRFTNATDSADPWLKGVNSSGTETFNVTKAGAAYFASNVGIGTTSPYDASGYNSLTLNGSTGSQIRLRTGDSDKGLIYNTANDFNIFTFTDPLRFHTNSTERMRIDSSGNCLFGTTTNGSTATGTVIRPFGETLMTRSSGPSLLINRTSSDGGLIDFRQDNTSEGSINVSGSTVSLIGAHLSRWSQLANGAARTEILRGSVLSNLDEMCEWGEEDNEQLNRMKVSDVEGDKNVSGVFQAWDDDDDTYTNDFYCAMTGDFVIRIAQGTTVARGDLLMSAGDGTAKPQDDDIVRSKTIAKVTSTIVSTTYSDNSYCVPCVLMAC